MNDKEHYRMLQLVIINIFWQSCSNQQFIYTTTEYIKCIQQIPTFLQKMFGRCIWHFDKSISKAKPSFVMSFILMHLSINTYKSRM